jgi:cytochrome c-type biogenesis protein CcmH
MRRLLSVSTVVFPLAVIVVGLLRGPDGAPDRGRSLAARLRCPVCSSESVADSPSRTAREMTALIDEQVADGRSDSEVLEFFRQRYGDWILLDPPRRGRTLAVWALPVVALAAGIVVVALQVRRRPVTV